jgi:aarF domain-containing kinase
MPKPLPSLCGEHVLTMTYLPGEKLETVLRREWERLGFAESDLRTRVTASSLGPRQLAWGLRLLRCKAALMDFGESSAAVWHWCLVRLGVAAPRPRVATQPRIPDRQVLLRTLLGVHAQQVLTDGIFNADLHPGNFLLLPDGRLGLIDYGQVKRIDDGVRRKLANLIVAVSRQDSAATVAALVELGVRSKKMNESFLNANAQLLFGRIDADLTGGRSLTDFFQDLRTWDTLTKMPGDLYLPSRAAIMLRGLALLLHCEISVAEEWRAAAEQVLLEPPSRTV